MLPAAASTVAAVPARGERWRVLGSFTTALYLGGPGRAVLPVVSADALLLPNAWRLGLPAADLAWGAAPGDPVDVAPEGSLHVAGLTLCPVRAWTPRPVRPVRPVSRPPGRATRVPTDRNCSHMDAAIATAGYADLRADPGEWVTSRIGLGPGLTPEGDDEVCGALLVAHAVADRTLWGAVAPALGRTTDLSASLLRCAADGLAVPQLIAFVDALLAGDHDLADRLRPAVLAIGHSSGRALVRGAEAALAALDEGEPVRA